MPQAEPDHLTATIVQFCQFARDNGLSNSVGQTLTALEAAKSIALADRQVFALALRTVLSSSRGGMGPVQQDFRTVLEPYAERIRA